MELFVPKRVYFEPTSLDYPLGQELYGLCKQRGIPIKMTGSHNRISGIPGKTPLQKYVEAKSTLVVGVRKSTDFATCKPSAHYQLPLVTSCPNMCEYCYLQTTLGASPYIRVYVNIDEILARCEQYIRERQPEITVFEGAATSDPIPVEYLTGSLERAIEFFGCQEYGRFRFVTKHTAVDSLLTAAHNGHTRFRFSINADRVIRNYEHHTPPLLERLQAVGKVAKAGYPVGLIIAPIMVFDDWRQEYGMMFAELDRQLTDIARNSLTFELISHRFTARAKQNILNLYPHSTLPMNEQERKFKFGQFGYGKYIYPKEVLEDIKQFMMEQLGQRFSAAKVEYFI